MNLNHSFTKRFKSSFKNKVRITAGLIVTMLITGNVAMAAADGYLFLQKGYNDEARIYSDGTVKDVSSILNNVYNDGYSYSDGTITGDLSLSDDIMNKIGVNNIIIRGDLSISGSGFNYVESYSYGEIFGGISISGENDNLVEVKSNAKIDGDITFKGGGENNVRVNSYGIINGNITFTGGGDNDVVYSDVSVDGTGNIHGDISGDNQITVAGGYDIEKNIYDFNVLKVKGQSAATLTYGYEVAMNPKESYTPDTNDVYLPEYYMYMEKYMYDDIFVDWEMYMYADDYILENVSTGLTINGILTLNTELSGDAILVPKIATYGGNITISDKGKIRFYVSGTGTEPSYKIIFGDDLSITNVVSDGNLVAEDGTLEYNDELFVETTGWSITDIDESGTQTVVTLTEKDVYEELMGKTQDSNKIKMINILDNAKDILGIHEALSNVAMDDAEKAVSELSGDIFSSLSDGHIKTNKMFTGKVNSMMSSPLTLRGERQSDFALLLENSTAELSSDTFTQAPNYSFLEGEEKYIQHFDILGTTGSNDKTGVEYDTHGSGFVGITERIMGNNSSLGLSYGYYDSRNDYDDGSDAETETFHLGMTHKLYFGNEYMLASHLGAEYSKNDVTREITTLGLQATSDYDSYSVSIGSDLSKNIKLSERVTLVPSIGAGYSRIERESFTESGSIGLAALDVEKQGLDSVTSRIGLRLDTDLTDKIVWFVGGSWEHEYADLNKDQEASFRGDANAESFKIKGTNIDEDTYSIMTGVNFNVNDSLTYRIMYSFTQQDDLGENNIDLGVSWKF